MTERRGRHGLRAAAVAAAALALAGCAADYVGDDWQCPLAQGSVCASVAAADPAVPETPVPEAREPAARIAVGLLDAPPYRPRTESATTEASGEPDCTSACDPLAWLAGLFGASDGSVASEERVDDIAVHPETGPASKTAITGPERELSETAASGSGAAEPETGSALPLHDGTDPARGDAVAADDTPGSTHDGGSNDDPRAPETVARVWIAPWVDADGIYREGSWVRAVIAPAGWRLP